jgi:hypothetical protein
MTSAPLRRAHADAAEDGRGGDRGVYREIVQVFEDLRGELAGRGEYQRSRGAAGLVDEAMQDGQEESRGLAAAGHRAGEDVLPGEGRRDGVGLDRGRPDEPELLDALEEVRMEFEGGEGHAGVLGFETAGHKAERLGGGRTVTPEGEA